MTDPSRASEKVVVAPVDTTLDPLLCQPTTSIVSPAASLTAVAQKIRFVRLVEPPVSTRASATTLEPFLTMRTMASGPPPATPKEAVTMNQPDAPAATVHTPAA